MEEAAAKADMSIIVIGNVSHISGAAGFTLTVLELESAFSLLKRITCFAIKSCRSRSAFLALRSVLALV